MSQMPSSNQPNIAQKTHGMLRLLLGVFLVLATVSGIIVLLNYRYEAVVDARYQDISAFASVGPDKQFSYIWVSNVGSSHGQYNFSYDFEIEHNVQAVNFGLASQSYDYDLAILQQYQECLANGGVVFIPVSFFSFNNEAVTDAEKKDLNTKYYYVLEPQYMPDYDFYTDLVTHRLPILSAQDDFFQIFPSLTLHADAAKLENTADYLNVPILANQALYDAYDAARVEELKGFAQSRMERHVLCKTPAEWFQQERIDNLYEIITLCQTHGVTPVLITTPCTEFYYSLAPEAFLTEFYAVIQEICDKTGVSYYNYALDDRIRYQLEYFADSDHLNADGSRYFMELLRTDVPEYRHLLQGFGFSF